MNRSLLGRSQKKNVSIPPLRDKDLSWILENDKKADVFGKSFEAKAELPEQEGEWIPKRLGTEQSRLLLLRTNTSEAILRNLNPDKATGQDALPAKILKICASELRLQLRISRGKGGIQRLRERTSYRSGCLTQLKFLNQHA